MLGATPDENLAMVGDSVAFCGQGGREVVYDAEHFFDGYKDDPAFALATLRAALAAGATSIVLCDTNGGTLTDELSAIIDATRTTIESDPAWAASPAVWGIHAHNDSELAVAASLAAVAHGIRHVQGTINGYGERCGNANLVTILADLALKTSHEVVPGGRVGELTELSRYVAEIVNIVPDDHQPYVGRSAFAHKGGVHVSAIQRHPETYEHIRPERVGNVTRVLVSDLSGRANILAKAEQFNINLDSKDPVTLEILETLKDLENKGYQFEGAEASFELLMRRALGTLRHNFSVVGFRVIDTKSQGDEKPTSEATVQVKVGGKIEHTAAEGNGPVNALDNALRKALENFYPQIRDMRLLDYKVRVLPAGKGTASVTRVLIESGDRTSRWGTVGVSDNIIDASYHALVDALQYKLFKDQGER